MYLDLEYILSTLNFYQQITLIILQFFNRIINFVKNAILFSCISLILRTEKTLKKFYFIWDIIKCLSVLRFSKNSLRYTEAKSKSYFNCCLYFHFHYSLTSKGWNIYKKLIAFYLYNLKTLTQIILQNNFQFLTFWLVFWYPGHPSMLQDVTATCFLKMWYMRPAFTHPNDKWRSRIPLFLERRE